MRLIDILGFIMVVIIVFGFGLWMSNSVLNQQEDRAKSLENVNVALNIQRFHDDEMNVTCWYSESGTLSVPPTISCIPDSQLRR